LLEGVLLDLAMERARTEPLPLEAWLQNVLEKIMKDETTMDYNDLARDLGMSAGSLRRKFKAATGTSLHNYVVQNRIARAKTMLTETDLPLKEIAFRLGYANVQFFSRQFRDNTRVAPGLFRRSRHS
jgi:AraC family transcriptional regulator